jgi:predicted SAM-dependent methyltransferase
MKLLNLCCGAVRNQSPDWINVDNLHATILPGTPERENLDKDENYINIDVETGMMLDYAKMECGSFDGILMSHCLEHWDCWRGVRIMGQCLSLLKPGGVLLVSVPDASYFREVHDEDTVENAERLFGEPIHLPDGETTFFGYGLWNRYHKAILSEDALWCYFHRAGFKEIDRMQFDSGRMVYPALVTGGPMDEMVKLINRIPFSLVMWGVKE